MELDALQQSLPQIQATGANLVTLSPQREPYLKQMVEKHHVTFELLRDEHNAVAAKFGLVFQLPPDLREVYKSFGTDLARVNGDDSWTLPLPARFVIDQRGIIRHVDVDPDYTIRPDPAETVAILQQLPRAKSAS
jgi:peroxiredoxin